MRVTLGRLYVKVTTQKKNQTKRSIDKTRSDRAVQVANRLPDDNGSTNQFLYPSHAIDQGSQPQNNPTAAEVQEGIVRA